MDIVEKAELSQQKEIEMLRAVPPSNNGPIRSTAGTILRQKWPEPLCNEAFYGLAGELVRAIEPHSEADVVALLANFLTSFGNVIGNYPHFKVEGDRHPTRLFCTLVGETSKARKGTSWGHIRNIFKDIDEFWNISGGLSSGEGLIWMVRDRIENSGEVVDEGVQDKRLLLVETEFSSILKVLSREGNTLSPNLRNAWDTGDLRSLTKNSPAKATNAHISILAHITKEELLQYLSDTEKANGFGNRFLWFCVRRSKSLPFGGDLNTASNIPAIKDRLKSEIKYATSAGEIKWAEETRPLWKYIYPQLSEGKPGLAGSMIARAEAYVVRLACIYALLDSTNLIMPDHLKAALAVWDYAEESTKYLFQEMTGSSLSDEIVSLLTFFPGGLTKKEINEKFNGHKTSLQLNVALNNLYKSGLVGYEIEPTNGRSKETWFLQKTGTGEHNPLNPLNPHKPDTFLSKIDTYYQSQMVNQGVPPISNL